MSFDLSKPGVRRNRLSVVGAVDRDDTALLRELLTRSTCYAHDDLAKGLHVAAARGHLECTRILLEHKALPDIHDASGATPLIIAAREGNTDIVQELIQAKCKINKPSFQVRATALHWAATNGHLGTAHALLRAGCDAEARTAQGKTPLMLAARSGHSDVIRLLIRAGVNVDKCDILRLTALHLAAEEGIQESVHELLKAGAKINCQTKHGDTPLMLSARRGHTEVVQKLLRRADVKLDCRSREMTVLHWAAEGGHPQVVGLILQYHTDPNVRTKDCYFGGEFVVNAGATPLMLACGGGYSLVAQQLLRHGALPDLVDAENMTALLHAVKHDHYACVEVLLEHGANPDGVFRHELGAFQLQENGSSPLIVAVARDAREALKALIRANCDVSTIGIGKEGDHVTALGLALSKGHFSVCKILLATGHVTNMGLLPPMDDVLAEVLQKDEDLFNLLVRRLYSPPLLMELCRGCIRECLGKSVLKTMDRLAIPPALERYMQLQELDDI